MVGIGLLMYKKGSEQGLANRKTMGVVAIVTSGIISVSFLEY